MKFHEIKSLSLNETRLAIRLGRMAMQRVDRIDTYEMDRLAALREQERRLTQIEASNSARRTVDCESADCAG